MRIALAYRAASSAAALRPVRPGLGLGVRVRVQGPYGSAHLPIGSREGQHLRQSGSTVQITVAFIHACMHSFMAATVLPRPPPSTVTMRSLSADPTTADRHARKW